MGEKEKKAKEPKQMTGKAYAEWFANEWAKTCHYLMAKHGDKISRIYITTNGK